MGRGVAIAGKGKIPSAPRNYVTQVRFQWNENPMTFCASSAPESTKAFAKLVHSSLWSIRVIYINKALNYSCIQLRRVCICVAVTIRLSANIRYIDNCKRGSKDRVNAKTSKVRHKSNQRVIFIKTLYGFQLAEDLH